MGIEPTCSAWKADILPLNYTRGFPETITLYPFRTRLSITIFRNFFAPRLQDIEGRGSLIDQFCTIQINTFPVSKNQYTFLCTFTYYFQPVFLHF